MSQAQAEELTTHICTVVAGTLERLEAKFATKTEAERVREQPLTAAHRTCAVARSAPQAERAARWRY